MFDNSGLVKLRRMGVVMYCWIKNATRRKKEPCTKSQKRKVQKMLSLQPSAMDRLNHELSVQRDRFVRLQSVQNDLALDLPHSIPLPDGEEIPYGSSVKFHIRDAQQESEIYQKCIRPPPNITITVGDPLPPICHLTSSRGSGWRSRGQSSKKSGDLFDRTVRCFGMRRSEEPVSFPPPPPPPCVHVPIHPSNRSRQISAFAERGSMDLSSVPAVSCTVPAQYMTGGRPASTISQHFPGETTVSHSAGITSAAVAPSAPATSVATSSGASATTTAAASAGTTATTSVAASAGTSSAALSGTSAAMLAGRSGDHYMDTKGPERWYERTTFAVPGQSGDHYMDTKGPERWYERSTFAVAGPSGEHYVDTKGPERWYERSSAAAGPSYSTNEFCDTRGPERRGERSSATPATGADKKSEKGSV